MRHISRKNVKPDPVWQTKADKITAELKAAPDEDARKAIIDRNSALWGELKVWLLSLSYERCWFSEAGDCFNHWHVEHFRPKKKAKDLDGTDHDCYWWLAFNWTNYRICGDVGNTKKGTYFPLRPGSTRAGIPFSDCRHENPMLLDPADPDDPNLLSFNSLGQAIIAPGITSAWEKERVTYSITRLQLDFGPLESKRKTVWNNCWDEIQLYLSELDEYSKSGESNMIACTNFKDHAKRIREMMQQDKELSTVARACVMSLGSDSRIARLLVTG